MKSRYSQGRLANHRLPARRLGGRRAALGLLPDAGVDEVEFVAFTQDWGQIRSALVHHQKSRSVDQG